MAAVFRGLQYEHRYLPRGLLLVRRVRRVRGDRPLPPVLTLGSADLARDHVLLARAVLEFDQGIRADIVVPERMIRCTALRRHHGVPAVVFHPHHRRLVHLAAPGAAIGHDHHRQASLAQRQALRPAGTLVQFDLIAHPCRRAGHVFSVNRHTHSQHQPLGRYVPGCQLRSWHLPKPTTIATAARPVETKNSGDWCAPLGGTPDDHGHNPRDATDNCYQRDACLGVPGLA